MAQKSPTKAELLEEIKRLQKMVKELQDDVIAYSQGIVQVENQMDTMRQAFQESYNPYSKGVRKSVKADVDLHAPYDAIESVQRRAQDRMDRVHRILHDERISINIKR